MKVEWSTCPEHFRDGCWTVIESILSCPRDRSCLGIVCDMYRDGEGGLQEKNLQLLLCKAEFRITNVEYSSTDNDTLTERTRSC